MRRYVLTAAVMLLSVAVSAQNLNPTVQVTNAYEGRLMEVEKQKVEMAVPDSLLKFDWDFGYSVFDNPYKGAYEFRPYLIEMRPDPTVYDGKKLYLRAGAGYSLHPQAQLYWTPTLKGRWGLTLYDDFKGYWGDWQGIAPMRIGGESYRTHAYKDASYFGSDMANKFGFTTRYDGLKTIVTLDGSLLWLETKERNSMANSALGTSAALRVRSNVPSDFTYDFSLKYDWTGDNLATGISTPLQYMEHDLGFAADLGYSIALHHWASLTTSYDHFIFSDHGDITSADWVEITPAYNFSGGRFSAHAGVKYSQVWSQVPVPGSYEEGFDYKGRRIYPDVKASFEAVPETLVLGAAVTGGQKFNSFRSYLTSNHHFPTMASDMYASKLGDASVNLYDAQLSLSGRLRSRMQYSLAAGYSRWYHAPLEGVSRLIPYGVPGVEDVFAPTYYMTNYNLLYAEANASWHSDRLDASALLRLQKSKFPDVTTALSLPAFVGSADVTYNFNKRLYVGVSAEWMTARHYDEKLAYPIDPGFSLTAPGWVDLGVNLEYKVNRKFSLWAQGQNLLCQTVMRDFMFAEKGPYGTAGITLNF